MWAFEPTARLRDFERVAGLKDARSAFINDLYETHLYGKPDYRVQSALEELRLWGRSDSDLRVYSPASMVLPESSEPRNVTWSALPTSFDKLFNSTREKFTYLDNRQRLTFRNGSFVITRIQDEYCEWVVKSNTQDNITEVLFTSEPPAYYDFMFYHSAQSHALRHSYKER
jgi:hypothetical protein